MLKRNYLKYIFTFIIISLLSTNSFVYTFAKNADDIEIGAQVALLVEETTGKVLYSKNSDTRVFPASTTKLITALVAIEHMDENEIYVLGEEINEVPWNSSKAGHVIGESILGINLFRGMLLPSGNETSAAVAKIVAAKVSGKNDLDYEEYEKIFSGLMNEKAKSLGCTGSNFVNPHGYHDDNHYTTAQDLMLIAQAVLKNSTLKSIAKEDFFIGTGAGIKGTDNMIIENYDWHNSNALLTSREFHYEYATGLKTGYTNEAGRCLVASAEKDDKSLISVIMLAEDPDRWNNTVTLFEYGFESFEYKTLLVNEQSLAELYVTKPQLGKSDKLDIYASDNYTGYFSKKELGNMKYEVEFFDEFVITNETNENYKELIAPISIDDEIGTLTYKSDDNVLFTMPLVIKEAIEVRSFKTDVMFFVNIIKDNAFTKKAIPFWIGFFILLILLIILISSYRAKRTKGFNLNRR